MEAVISKAGGWLKIKNKAYRRPKVGMNC